MATKDHWGHLASDFHRRQAFITGEAMIALIKRILEELTDLGDLLELGCGDGGFTPSLAGQARSIVATDCSRPMVTEAKKMTASMDNVTVELADCMDLPYSDGRFDSVFMGNLLHVIGNPSGALVEAHRVLRPGGRVIVLSFTIDGMTPQALEGMIERYLKAFGPPPEVRDPLTVASTKELLEEAGFLVTHRELLQTEEASAVYLVAIKT